MDRGKKSLYTALTAISLTLLNGLFGLLITKLIITNYGSDFNGLNSTASQFISMLLLVEGGFTLAINVALLKPLANKDEKAINKIMVATKNTFNKIGIIFFVVGVVLSISYSMIIKTDLPLEIVILTFLMTIVSTSFNLLYATKYRILIQTEQREYILNLIQICTLVLSQLMIILIINYQGNMLFIRFATMVGAILNSLLVGYVFKKNSNHIDFKVEPDYDAIKGTKDIFAQKITSMVYSTVPVIFMSATVGTIFTSVYIVYNSIFILLKSMIYALINAPRIGFGKLISEKNNDYVFKVFMQYEYIVINVMLILLSTTSVLIIPFISIYTSGFGDMEYQNWTIALLLIGITFFEIIHIPSGNIINMAGKFRTGRKIQNLACVVLVIVMILGNYYWEFYGIILAVMIAAILLAILEIRYVYKVYFKKSINNYFKLLLPNLFFAIILILIEITLLPKINGFINFLFVGFILVLINGITFLIFNLTVNKSISIEVINRIRNLVSKKISKNS